MKKHYFYCICGKKCRVIQSEIRDHLWNETHHQTFLKKEKNEIDELNEKMDKLFRNSNKMTEMEYIKKCAKYKKKFENVTVKVPTKYHWYHSIEVNHVNIYSVYNEQIIKKYKCLIHSNVEV